MKVAISIFFCLFTSVLIAQTPFLEPTYEEVEVIHDITYGVNGTMLTIPLIGEVAPIDLNMDVYLPINNDEQRPLVIILQESYYLPILVNGRITGTRGDSSMVEMCTRLAKYGYATAAIDYRTGWNPLSPTGKERAYGLITATYRAIQDGRTAVRYFKKTVAEDGNPYALDTTKIAIIGIESAGLAATGMATLDDLSKIENTTNGPLKFLIDLDGNGTTESPMIHQDYHGDIEGKILTITPDNNYDFPSGDTTNYQNHVEYSSNIQLAMHVSGGIPDISWIDNNSAPILSFHPYQDEEYPYYDALYIIYGTPVPIFDLQGGHFIAQRQSILGIAPTICENIEYPLEEEAQQNSQIAGHQWYPHLFPFENIANSNGILEGVVIDWWDPNTISPPVMGFPNGLPWNELPHPSGDTFHDYNLLFNEDMSAEKAKINIQKLIDFFTPHAHCILNLSPVVNTSEIIPNEEIVISPNPSSGILNISNPNTTKIYGVEMYNSNGQKVFQKDTNGENEITLEHYSIPKGIYFLKILLKNNTLTRKVILTE